MLNPYKIIKVKITSIKQETDTIKLFKIKVARPIIFKAGQFFLLSYPGFGEGPFAPCSMPGEHKEIEFAIRKVGNLTNKLQQLNEEDNLWLRGPYGHGWFDKSAKRKAQSEKPANDFDSDDHTEPNLLLVAGGMGIVPLRPVILEKLNDKNTKIQVFYGAKNPQELLFKNDYDDWKKAGVDLQLTVDQKMPNWFGNVGIITTLCDKVKMLCDGKCFVVGPPIMLKFIIPKLVAAGFKDEDIFVSLERRMHCGLGVCQHCAVGSKYVCHDGPIFSWQEIKQMGAVAEMM